MREVFGLFGECSRREGSKGHRCDLPNSWKDLDSTCTSKGAPASKASPCSAPTPAPSTVTASWFTWGQSQRVQCECHCGEECVSAAWHRCCPPTHLSHAQGPPLWGPAPGHSARVRVRASVNLLEKKIQPLLVVTHLELKFSISSPF